MINKSTLCIIILLVFNVWCRVPEKNRALYLGDVPADILRFFESDEWGQVVNEQFKSSRKLYLSDYTVEPPVYYVVIHHYIQDSSLLYIEEANECQVTLQQDKMRALFRFHKVDNKWLFKDLFIRFEREPSLDNRDDYIIKKPILYLYPPSPINVQVKLEFEEKLTYCYPPYPEEGWNVTAYPDGTLQRKSDKKKFYALFWEGQMDFEMAIDEGFVVPADSIEIFLEDKLTLIGLNFRERQEFIIYWAPLMKKNPYSLIHFSIDEYKKEFPLKVMPKPDSEIRVNMLFKVCDAETTIIPQVIKPGKREGFTLVEWGGTDLDLKSASVQ